MLPGIAPPTTILLSLTRIETRDGGGLCLASHEPDSGSVGFRGAAVDNRAPPPGRTLRAPCRELEQAGNLSDASVDAATGRPLDASLLVFGLDTAHSAHRVTAHRLVTRVVRERLRIEGSLMEVGAAAARLPANRAD